MPTAAVRLHAILGRKSRRAVVLRRGPSRQVLLCLWDRDTDRVEPGQWLKARIYEHRCDLSPSGEHFLYFAADWKPPYHSWTAVSRPPWLTAIALWPKGDAWGGGGVFIDDRTIGLNHAENQLTPAPDLSPPRGVKVVPFGPYSGQGEESPLVEDRMAREGWTQSRTGVEVINPRVGAKSFVDMKPPHEWRLPRGEFVLIRRLDAIHERNGPWLALDYELQHMTGETVLALGRADWAAWDDTGDLLFAQDGRLYRLRRSDLTGGRERALEVFDFRPLRFEPRAAPPRFRKW